MRLACQRFNAVPKDALGLFAHKRELQLWIVALPHDAIDRMNQRLKLPFGFLLRFFRQFSFGDVLYDQDQISDGMVGMSHALCRYIRVNYVAIPMYKTLFHRIAFGFASNRLLQQPNVFGDVIRMGDLGPALPSELDWRITEH